MMNVFNGGPGGKKGFILVTAILVITILLIVLLPYISRVAGEYKLSMKLSSSTVAINIAEAVVEKAIWEIRYHDYTFTGWTPDLSTPPTQWTITGAWYGSGGKNIGQYDAVVLKPAGSNTKTITVTAYVPSKTSPVGTKTVKVKYYSEGLFSLGNAVSAVGSGVTGVKLDSNINYVDSYDSKLGAYGVNQTETSVNQGDVVTNGDIQMSAATAHIQGTAYYGVDGKFTGGEKKEGKCATGGVKQLDTPIVMNFPTAELTAASTANNNSAVNGGIKSYGSNDPATWKPYNETTKALSVTNGASIELPAGTYYFTSITTSGGTTGSPSIINVGGKATVYVAGGAITTSDITQFNKLILNDDNGVSEGSPLPSNFIIYSSGASVSLGDTYTGYGVIYAPNATVNMFKGDLYGAVVCNTILMRGDANLHFDIQLKGGTPPTNNNRVESWQEL